MYLTKHGGHIVNKMELEISEGAIHLFNTDSSIDRYDIVAVIGFSCFERDAQAHCHAHTTSSPMEGGRRRPLCRTWKEYRIRYVL